MIVPHGVAGSIQVISNVGLPVGDHLPAGVFPGIDQALFGADLMRIIN